MPYFFERGIRLNKGIKIEERMIRLINKVNRSQKVTTVTTLPFY